MRALSDLLEYEFAGEDKRFFRYTANLLRVISGGRQVDLDKVGWFSEEVGKAYKAPWAIVSAQTQETGEQIVQWLLE